MVPIPGLNELVILVFVALCVFGTSKLPAIGTSLGKALWRLKRRAGLAAPPSPESAPQSGEEPEDEPEDLEEEDDEDGRPSPTE
jgi:TatA/E family protein of Tat protein translocase